MKNFSGHDSVVNCAAINEDGVAVTCGDDGSLCFWDYDTGYCFQKSKTLAQSGKQTSYSICKICVFIHYPHI